MSYTALYRKFRPVDFDNVKGQDHIVTTLKNQIKSDRLGHAYLFCGTRGTGKTSIAKIFARAVNCENPVDGSPCNECETCKSISAGTSMNVIEIDAASNNGVENIRGIIDEVQYSPTEGRYKVYIIDEVHMLSIGAFNALLKTLEEPPSYVIFILATTEPQKIPITILSRCQRYDFKRITIDTIYDRLNELMLKENVETEERALRYVAKAADGSMRDALSLLDQCIAFYMDDKLTYDKVLEVLGAVDIEVFSEMLRAVISGDTVLCIHKLEEIIISGKEQTQFVADFTWYMRNLMLVKTSEDASDIIDVSTERLNALKEESKMIGIDTLLRYIRIFSDLSNQIKYASNKRVLIEIALIKLTKPSMEMNLDSVLNRLSILEKKIEEGVTVVSAAVPAKVEAPKAREQRLMKAVPEDVQNVADNWYKIDAKMPPFVKSYLKDVRLSATGDNVLLMIFSNDLAYGVINKPDNVQIIRDTIADIIQKEVKIELKLLKQNEQFEDNFEEVLKNINFEIEEVEED